MRGWPTDDEVAMEPQTRKRSYSKPRIREYGDVRQLTEDIQGGRGKHDSAFYGMVQLKTGA